MLCGNQIYQLLYSRVRLVVRHFDFGRWVGGFLGSVVEKGVRQWAAGPLVEKDRHGGCPFTFCCESIAVLPAVALQKTVLLEEPAPQMALHLAQVTTELGQSVSLRRESKGCLDGSWIGAVRQPASWEPPWSSTSIRRIMRMSWILMPRILLCLRTPKIWAILSAVRRK